MTAPLDRDKATRRGDHRRLDAAEITDLLPEYRRADWDRLARDITLAVRGDPTTD